MGHADAGSTSNKEMQKFGVLRYVGIHINHFFSSPFIKYIKNLSLFGINISNLCINLSICIQTKSCYEPNLDLYIWLSRIITGFITTMTIIIWTTRLSKHNSVWIISIFFSVFVLALHVKKISNFTIWFKPFAISFNCF